MTLTTDKGKTFEVNWAWGPTHSGTLMAELAQDMTAAKAARAFDGCETIQTSDPNEGERTYTGYSRLIGIVRSTAAGTVQLTWEQGGDGA